jgi:RimJ/RimL family protein N-acetyltransferase
MPATKISKQAFAIAAKANLEDHTRFTLPIFNDQSVWIGKLICIDQGLANTDSVIADLTAWRQKYMAYFLTQFQATPSRTQTWLNNIVIPSPDRILFLIQTADNEIIGNFGVCNIQEKSLELDNLIRGKAGGDRKLIYDAEIAMLSWAFGALGCESVCLHVFSNNDKTIALHTKVGFKPHETTPLYGSQDGDFLRYSADPQSGEAVDFSYLEMRLSPLDFLQNHAWVKTVYGHDWNAA